MLLLFKKKSFKENDENQTKTKRMKKIANSPA